MKLWLAFMLGVNLTAWLLLYAAHRDWLRTDLAGKPFPRSLSIAGSITVIVLLAGVLAGCNTSTGAGGTVKPVLPDLPPKATAICPAPTAKVGDDLGVLAARWKATAVCEGGKRATLLVFYRDLKTRFAGK